MSMEEKAKASEKRWIGPKVPLLLLTSALTAVMNDSETSAGRRDPRQ